MEHWFEYVGYSAMGFIIIGAAVSVYEDCQTDKEHTAHQIECNDKNGTYLSHDDLCLDIQHLKLGGDTSKITATIYGAQWCDTCEVAASYLRRRHIKFVEKDIDYEENKKEMNEVLDKAEEEHGLIPVVVIGKTVIRGYSEWDMRAAIEKNTIYQEQK